MTTTRGRSCRSRRSDSDDFTDTRSEFFSVNSSFGSPARPPRNDSISFASDESSYGNDRNVSTSSRYRAGGNSPSLNVSSIRSDSRRSDSSFGSPARPPRNESISFASDESSYGNGRNPSTSSRYRAGGNSPSLNISSIRADSTQFDSGFDSMNRSSRNDSSTFASDESSYGNGRNVSTSSRYRPAGDSPTLDVSSIAVENDDDVFLPEPGTGKAPPRKRLDFAAARSESDSEPRAQKFNLSVEDFPADEFVGSQKVANLNRTSFYDLLGSKDITLVFFYDPRKPESATYKDNVKQASGCTKRANHAFAAVNCKTNNDLCLENGVLYSPLLRLYKGLEPTQTIVDPKTPADVLRRTVEQG